MLLSCHLLQSSESRIGAIEELPHICTVFGLKCVGTPLLQACFLTDFSPAFLNNVAAPFQKAENSCRGRRGLPLNLALAYTALVALGGGVHVLSLNENKREINEIANGSW